LDVILMALGSAEEAINDRLAQNPQAYLLGLSQLAVSADAEVVSD
jgi:hypothetical protein